MNSKFYLFVGVTGLEPARLIFLAQFPKLVGNQLPVTPRYYFKTLNFLQGKYYKYLPSSKLMNLSRC